MKTFNEFAGEKINENVDDVLQKVTDQLNKWKNRKRKGETVGETPYDICYTLNHISNTVSANVIPEDERKDDEFFSVMIYADDKWATEEYRVIVKGIYDLRKWCRFIITDWDINAIH